MSGQELGAWLRRQREARAWARSEMARQLIRVAHSNGDTSIPGVVLSPAMSVAGRVAPSALPIVTSSTTARLSEFHLPTSALIAERIRSAGSPFPAVSPGKSSACWMISGMCSASGVRFARQSKPRCPFTNPRRPCMLRPAGSRAEIAAVEDFDVRDVRRGPVQAQPDHVFTIT